MFMSHNQIELTRTYTYVYYEHIYLYVSKQKMGKIEIRQILAEKRERGEIECDREILYLWWVHFSYWLQNNISLPYTLDSSLFLDEKWIACFICMMQNYYERLICKKETI